MNCKAATMALAVLMSGSEQAHSAPPYINFQGFLRDSAGHAVSDNVYALKFRIYDDSVGGSLLWETSAFVPLQTTNGIFNHLLGSSNSLPDSVFDSDGLWIGVAIGTDPEMMPRTRLSAVPFAFRVRSLAGSQGGAVTGDLSVSGAISALAGGYHFPDGSVQNSAAQSSFDPLGGLFRFHAAINAVASFTAPADKSIYITSIAYAAYNTEYITIVRIDGVEVLVLETLAGFCLWTGGGAALEVGPGQTVEFSPSGGWITVVGYMR